MQALRPVTLTVKNGGRPENWWQCKKHSQKWVQKPALVHERPLYNTSIRRCVCLLRCNYECETYMVVFASWKLLTLFWGPRKRVLLIRECRPGSPPSLYSPLSGCALKCAAPSFTSSHLRNGLKPKSSIRQHKVNKQINTARKRTVTHPTGYKAFK